MLLDKIENLVIRAWALHQPVSLADAVVSLTPTMRSRIDDDEDDDEDDER